MKVLLSKQKENRNTEFTTVYVNSTAKKSLISISMVLTNLFKNFYKD